MEQYEAGYADLKPTRQTGLEEATIGGHKPTEAELEDLFRAPDDNDRGSNQKHYTPSELPSENFGPEPDGVYPLRTRHKVLYEVLWQRTLMGIPADVIRFDFDNWDDAFEKAKALAQEADAGHLKAVVIEETEMSWWEVR